jgi:GT2 family glycosyltransferase
MMAPQTSVPSFPAAPPAACPLIICVIVNFNGWRDTLNCLASLSQQDYPRLEVIVIDNGSADGSAARICEAHPWVTLIETGRNLGFPAGCNAGIRAGYARGAEFLWCLNNDTIAPPDTASLLAATALAHPEAGAIGSILYYMHDPSQVQAWGGGKVSLWSGFVSHFTQPQPFTASTTFFTGASILVPRKICEEVGILFEGFFMYCDDSDLCIRLHRAGYPLVVAEGTAILHKEGGSSPRRSPLIDQFATTANLRLLQRHGRLPAVAMGVYLFLRLLNRASRGEWANFAAVLRGTILYQREKHLTFPERL